MNTLDIQKSSNILKKAFEIAVKIRRRSYLENGYSKKKAEDALDSSILILKESRDDYNSNIMSASYYLLEACNWNIETLFTQFANLNIELHDIDDPDHWKNLPNNEIIKEIKQHDYIGRAVVLQGIDEFENFVRCLN